MRIKNGKLAGQVRDAAYQATTTDFWGSMSAVGGPQTYVLGGAFNCGKGQPGQVAAVSHGCPSALFNQVRILNTTQEAGEVSEQARPQELVERALAASSTDGCIVIASDTAATNLRWANNTLTTNGVTQTVGVTVVATVDGSDGVRTGIGQPQRRSTPTTSSPASPRPRSTARDSAAVDDANDLITAPASPDWDCPPFEAPVAALSDLAHWLGEIFGAARDAGQGRYGFAEHSVVDDVPRVVDRTSAAARPAGGQGRADRALGGRHPLGVERSGGERDRRRSTSPRLEADVAKRLAWSERRVVPRRRALRRRSCRRPRSRT